MTVTRAVTVEEAFEIDVPAIVPASRSNAFELFADTYTGGTYSLSGTDAAAFQMLQTVPLRQLLCSSLSLAVTMKE